MPIHSLNDGSKNNSAGYVKLLMNEPMNFPLEVSPIKEMGDHTRQIKKGEIEPTTFDFQ